MRAAQAAALEAARPCLGLAPERPSLCARRVAARPWGESPSSCVLSSLCKPSVARLPVHVMTEKGPMRCVQRHKVVHRGIGYVFPGLAPLADGAEVGGAREDIHADVHVGAFYRPLVQCIWSWRRCMERA